MRSSDPFDGGGIAAHWSVATRRKTAGGYGRFLFWLKERNELDVTGDPASRITRERLTAYLDDLRRANRGHTIQCRVQELGDAMQALAPEKDWRFIKRAARRLRETTIPIRGQALAPTSDCGRDCAGLPHGTGEAEGTCAVSELGGAARYRDGLLLVFLAYHPLRLRNLSSLRIGRHLVVQDDRIVLLIDALETKTRQRIEQELSPRLCGAVTRYIDRYRPALLRARGRWHAPVADKLWISRDGSPCSDVTLRNVIGKHVVGPNGQPLSPHLFRSMAATSVSIEAPGSVDLIPAILRATARAGPAKNITDLREQPRRVACFQQSASRRSVK